MTHSSHSISALSLNNWVKRRGDSGQPRGIHESQTQKFFGSKMELPGQFPADGPVSMHGVQSESSRCSGLDLWSQSKESNTNSNADSNARTHRLYLHSTLLFSI